MCFFCGENKIFVARINFCDVNIFFVCGYVCDGVDCVCWCALCGVLCGVVNFLCVCEIVTIVMEICWGLER